MSSQLTSPLRICVMATVGLLAMASACALPEPGATRHSAASLGEISFDDRTQYSRSQSLDRANGNGVDYYVFDASIRSGLFLEVSGQSINLDVWLEDTDGNTLIRSGPRPGDAIIESLDTEINQGTYYVRVEAMEDGQSDYHLQIDLVAFKGYGLDLTGLSYLLLMAVSFIGSGAFGLFLSAVCSRVAHSRGAGRPVFIWGIVITVSMCGLYVPYWMLLAYIEGSNLIESNTVMYAVFSIVYVAVFAAAIIGVTGAYWKRRRPK